MGPNNHIQARKSFHLKARRVMEDFARKAGKWVVEVAESPGANIN